MSTPEANSDQSNSSQASSYSKESSEKIEEKDQLATAGEISAVRDFINNTSEEYSTKGSRNKKGAIFFQGTVTLLSVITTVFLGWNTKSLPIKTDLLNIALICSTVVSGLNVIIAFFDYKELWVQYKVSRNRLNILAADLKFLEVSAPDKIKRSDIQKIFENYKIICNETNQNYQQLRMANDTIETKNNK